MNALLLAASAGLSLGVVLGYRAAKVVFLKVTGPYARSWLPIGFAVAGAVIFFIPASVFAVFIVRNLLGPSAGGNAQVSLGMLVAVAAGIGLVVASGLVVAAFAGAVSARFIHNVRDRSR